jgi:hypothetical protein
MAPQSPRLAKCVRAARGSAALASERGDLNSYDSALSGNLLLAGSRFGAALESGRQPVAGTDYGPLSPTSFDYYVGYRAFDQYRTSPVYPFGYGLSYTGFDYRKLQLGCSDMSKGAVLPVVVNVANTGTVAGDEVVMVFVSFPGTTARRPTKELKGFTRVHLEAGEEKQVAIPVRLADLDYFQASASRAGTGQWVVETGDVTIMVGGSSTNLPLSATVKVNGY